MVFSSVPHVYLDPPNWNQQGHQQGASSITGSDVQHQLQQTTAAVPTLQPATEAIQGTAGGVSRPGSMVERARLAKIPQPEAALKCPRCDSTNTKFCYFNNYSLTQPRHFCKTCRRYWTRGGTLRNVPVGGGCRRNKRSNKSSSRSLAAAPASASASPSSTSAASAGIFQPASLPFMTPWNPLPEYGFCGIQSATPVDASEYSVRGGGASSNVGFEQWGIHQLPFLGSGMVSSTSIAPATAPTAPGLYPFEGELVGGYGAGDVQLHARAPTPPTGSTGLSSMPREFLGVPRSDQHHLWSVGGGSSSGGGGTGGGWLSNHLSGFNSSSTGNWL